MSERQAVFFREPVWAFRGEATSVEPQPESRALMPPGQRVPPPQPDSPEWGAACDHARVAANFCVLTPVLRASPQTPRPRPWRRGVTLQTQAPAPSKHRALQASASGSASTGTHIRRHMACGGRPYGPTAEPRPARHALTNAWRRGVALQPEMPERAGLHPKSRGQLVLASPQWVQNYQ